MNNNEYAQKTIEREKNGREDNLNLQGLKIVFLPDITSKLSSKIPENCTLPSFLSMQ
jgi:hypothetical protein